MKKRFPLAAAGAVGRPFADVLAGLVSREEPEADGDAGGEEELRGHGDDAVHEVGLDDLAADVPFAAGVAGGRAVGHDEPGHAAAPAVGIGEVVDEVLNPGVVGIADGRIAEGPAFVAAQEWAGVIGNIERRIGEDEVSLEIGMGVAKERVGGRGAEVRLNAVDGEVHVGQSPGGRVGLLAEDGDVGLVAAVGFGKLFGLDEHAAGAASGVVDAAGVGFEHLDQHADDGARRVELAAELAFGSGELAEEVFVDSAERVARLIARALEADASDEIDQPGHLHRVDATAGVVAREF